MNTRETLDNILNHTYGSLKNLNAIKINAKEDEVLVSSYTEDKGIIVNGTISSGLTKKPAIFGCMRLDVLQSCLTFDLFKQEEDGDLSIKYQNDVPVSLVFDSAYGHSAEYRLTSESIIENHVDIDHIVDIPWDIDTEVHQILYEQFRKVSVSFAKSNNNRFSIKSGGDGYLYFVVGGGGSDSMEFPVLESKAKWNSSFKWSIENFNAIMRICSSYEKTKISITEKYGMIKLEPVTEDDYQWQYYIQATKSSD